MWGSRFRLVTREELVLLLNLETWRTRLTSEELIARRNAAIVALVAFCGVRPNELQRLTICDWRSQGREMLRIVAPPMRGGVDAARWIPLLETPQFIVDRYLALHPWRDNPEAPLVITRKGTPFVGNCINYYRHRVVGQRIGLGSSLLVILRGSFEARVRSAQATDGSEELLLGHPQTRSAPFPEPSEGTLRRILEEVLPLPRCDRLIWRGPGLPDGRNRKPTRGRSRKPRLKKLTGLSDYLTNLLKEEPDLTQKEIQERLRSERALTVHTATVATYLRGLRIGRYANDDAYDRRPLTKLKGLGHYLATLFAAEPRISNVDIAEMLRRDKGVSVSVTAIRHHRLRMEAGKTISIARKTA